MSLVRRKIVLAVHQAPPRHCVADSVAAIVDAVQTLRSQIASSPDSDAAATAPAMLLFSELFVGGYGSGDALVHNDTTIEVPLPKHAVSASPELYHGSQWLQPIREACARSRIGVVFGFSERCAASSSPVTIPQHASDHYCYYNAAVAIGDDGAVLAAYRKVHLWGQYESSFFRPGDNLLGGRFSFHGIECGILICFDVEFPESVRVLALDGAEVVLVPTALVNRFNACTTVPSRAFENNCVVCYANEVGADPHLTGVTYCGLSVVALPDGSEGCRMPESVSVPCDDAAKIAWCAVDLDSEALTSARLRNDYRACRRPELYAAVAKAS